MRPFSATSIEISEILETRSIYLDYYTSKLRSPSKESILHEESSQIFVNNLKLIPTVLKLPRFQRLMRHILFLHLCFLKG